MSLDIPKAIVQEVASLPEHLKKFKPWLLASLNRLFQDAAIETDQGIYLATGDIPAMWLRDSSFQIRPLIRFSKDPEVYDFCAKVISQQAFYIGIDPYANAFNPEPNGFCWHKDFPDQKPWVFERKWEIDSLASFLDVSHRLALVSGRKDHMNLNWERAVASIIEVFTTEQNHDPLSYKFVREGNPQHDYLSHGGLGAPFKSSGLIWSAFRPSDDACQLPFNIPQNAYASASLNKIAGYLSPELRKKCLPLSQEIRDSIEAQALTESGYAYEIDGLGNAVFLDDANIPSLLSLPYLGYCEKQDPRYLRTREFVLSANNPWFFEGDLLAHVGSPHTGQQQVWPLAMAMEVITDVNPEISKLETLAQTAPTYAFHESVNVNDFSKFTREWFSWADMTFLDAVFVSNGK